MVRYPRKHRPRLGPNYEIKRTPEVTLRSNYHLRPAPLISALGVAMVPFGLSEIAFVSMYQRKLDSLMEEAIGEIRGLLRMEIGVGVKEANIEVFLDEYSGVPRAWAYWHGRHNKIDRLDTSLHQGRSLELSLGLGKLESISEEYFNDAEVFPGVSLIVPLLLRWLAEAWWKAGGWDYALPTTLAVHDYESDGLIVLSKGRT